MDLLELLDHKDNKCSDLLLNVLLNKESFKKDAEKKNHVEKNITTTINNKLEHAETFFQGLLLFDKFIPTLSKDNLTKYFQHWMSKLMQKLSNGNPDELHILCKSIGILITSCKQEPDLDKKISIFHVKELLSIIFELYSKRSYLSLLNLLNILLYHYPEACGRSQTCWSNIISSSLDAKDDHLINATAKCYALLIRVKERQFIHLYKENYIIMPENNSASCHIYYQVNLCHYLHDIMDKLFQNFVTATIELPSKLQNAKNNTILDLPEISQENMFEYYFANTNRFTNICTFLCTLLKVGCSGRKFVLPNVILHVVCRGLSITPVNLEKSDESRKDLLLLILPKLYIGLLNVTEALITSFQQELVPFALNVQKLILQTLDWTQTFYNEIFKDIRIHAYKILSVWVCQTRSLSGFQLVADEVLLHILKDISQSNDKVQILKSSKNSKNNSKADKTAENEKCKSNGTIHPSTYNYSDSVLCLQVLLTVEFIISNASCHLKQSFYDRIRNAVVLQLYNQYIKKTSIASDKNNINYRLQLLKSLRVLEIFTQGSSSTSHAIHIFQLIDSQETNSKIIAEARLALAELRNIIYPTAPTLMLPMEKTENLLIEKSSILQNIRLEDIIPIKETQQIPEAITPTIRKTSESDYSVESKRPKLTHDTVEIVQKISEVEFEAVIENKPLESESVVKSKPSETEEISDSNTADDCSNSEKSCKEKEKSVDPNEEEMVLAFCDVE